MLTTEREKKICAKYSECDDTGHVRCGSCPLVKDHRDLLCKANSSYNRRTGLWEPDDCEEVIIHVWYD